MSEKPTEVEIIPKVAQHFRELGYSENQIETEVSKGATPAYKYDFVISGKDNTPSIVVEVKASKKMPASDDAAHLRFHPTVRQAQIYSEQINASYFVVTDGVSYLWFKTDDSGRPLLTSR